MAEDDVEVVIDAEMGGNAVAGLAEAARQAQALADALERARAAGGVLGGAFGAPGETPFSSPGGGGGPGGPSPAAMASQQQNQALAQRLAVRDQQTAQETAAAQQEALGYVDYQDPNAADAGGGAHIGWRAQMHGLRMLAGGNQDLSRGLMGGMAVATGRFGLAGTIGGATEAGSAGINLITEAMGALSNSALTASEQTNALVGKLPLIGTIFTAMTGFMDMMSGAAEKLRQQQTAFANIGGAIAAEASRTSKENPLLADLAGSQAGVAATAGILPNYGNAPDPVADPAGYAAWKANIGTEDKRVSAERATFEAKAKQQALVDQLPQLQERLAGGKALEARGSAALEQLGLGGKTWGEAIMTTQESSADIKRARDAAFALQGAGLESQQGAAAAIEANITAQKQAQLDIDKQAQQLGQVRIDQLNEQLKIQSEQVSKAASQYSAIGGLDDASKQNALLALQQAQTLGVQSLTSEQKSLIGQVGGSAKLQELQRDYAGSADQIDMTSALRQAVATSGAADQAAAGMSLPDLIAQQQATQQQILAQQQANAENAATATSDSMEKYTNEVIAAIERGIEVIRRKTSLQALEKQVNAK